ncbi:MAG: tetratricopeptide (TPR) repeat protein [Polaribacter sp.]|jgi:tetratricopeptide (TPR) repeat protein
MNLTRVDKVFKLFKTTIFCFFIFLNISVFSQDQPIKSSINKDAISPKNIDELLRISKEYISKKDYDNALFFLSKYYTKFSENLYVNWLYAHALSMNNNDKQAEKKFNKAISIDAKNQNLQLDYARFLYKIGKINKVDTILSRFLNENSSNVEFLLMQAHIRFWKGDIKNAEIKIKRIQDISPDKEITKSLEDQIKELTALYVSTNFEYQTDSQPLDIFGRHIVLSKYVSRFLNPQLEISNYRFSSQEERALAIKLSNQFHFDKLKLSANLTSGVYLNLATTADWVGGLTFSKKLFKNTSLNFGYSKNRLIGTIISSTFNLTHENVFGEIDYNNKWVLLHAWYTEQFFKDNNQIQTFGAWMLSQPIKIKKFHIQFGYSYNYTDSKDVLFFYDNQGVGVYDPYFTPKEQEIHSGLLIVNYKPTKKLSLEAKVNYGFIGTIRNPYPIQITATKIEVGGLYDETFTPVEYTGIINYSFSNRFSAKITYINQETFFYKRENINLGLNFNN